LFCRPWLHVEKKMTKKSKLAVTGGGNGVNYPRVVPGRPKPNTNELWYPYFMLWVHFWHWFPPETTGICIFSTCVTGGGNHGGGKHHVWSGIWEGQRTLSLIYCRVIWGGQNWWAHLLYSQMSLCWRNTSVTGGGKPRSQAENSSYHDKYQLYSLVFFFHRSQFSKGMLTIKKTKIIAQTGFLYAHKKSVTGGGT
jgi:hypothetical protein